MKKAHYAPTLVDVETITEIWGAAGTKGFYWTEKYTNDVLKNAIYTASYGGRILLWYLYDDDEYAKRLSEVTKYIQKEAGGNPTVCHSAIPDLCPSCDIKSKELKGRTLARSCHDLYTKLVETGNKFGSFIRDPRGAHFRLIVLNPFKMIPLKEPTNGPLVPLFIDGRTVLLFEASLPGLDSEYEYVGSVNIGHHISCQNR